MLYYSTAKSTSVENFSTKSIPVYCRYLAFRGQRTYEKTQNNIVGIVCTGEGDSTEPITKVAAAA